ncbi:hypothetical protein C0580_03985 [Candidatus Parcubacteria bacterium]|nr:MAG: hypothetical protein C0580_03985 [Candidatus Parcubacteria bacterium]
MNENIKNILEDIYSIDDSLRKHEKDLIKIIKTLLAAKPKAKYDEAFRQELRAELLEKFAELEEKQSKGFLKINFKLMNKLPYAIGGLILGMLVLLPFVSKDNILPGGKQINIGLESEIAKLSSNNAFGKINSDSDASLAARNAATEETVAGFGGGGSMTAYEKSMISSVMPAPMQYSYIYEGEDISLDDELLPVLKKVKGTEAQKSLAKILQNADFENIQMTSFSNSHLRNFQISEEEEYGYTLYVDLHEGMMSIMENWEMWPQPEVMQTLSPNQVPDDQTLLNIANKFLQEKKIDTSQYGQPHIDDNWRMYYDQRLAEGLDYYVPESIGVIYPQMVDGQMVYDEWGNPHGMNVTVNIRYNRVSSVHNISTQKYQSSDYDMETDVNKIIKLAEQGGSYTYYQDENAQNFEIKLGTPTYSYVQIWQHDGRTSNQLFVPALIFPVTEKPDNEYFFKENVVVPLAKDMVEQRLNPPIYPEDQPEILLK